MRDYKLKLFLFSSVAAFLLGCSSEPEDKSTPVAEEAPSGQTVEKEIDTAYLEQVENAWQSKHPIPTNSPNEIMEVMLKFRFTSDTIADYLVVSRLDRYAKGFIVDGETGAKIEGDTLLSFEAENMVWSRPANGGLTFNEINVVCGDHQHELEVLHTWKLETSTVTDYCIYRYDEADGRSKLILKTTLRDEEVGRNGTSTELSPTLAVRDFHDKPCTNSIEFIPSAWDTKGNNSPFVKEAASSDSKTFVYSTATGSFEEK